MRNILNVALRGFNKGVKYMTGFETKLTTTTGRDLEKC